MFLLSLIKIHEKYQGKSTIVLVIKNKIQVLFRIMALWQIAKWLFMRQCNLRIPNFK